MASLYPTPKTQAERDAVDAARKERQKKELPRAPWLLVPLLSGVVFWLIVQFVQIAPVMWESGSIPFIFFSFAIWLGVGGLTVAWALYAHRVLYAHGKSLAIFWLGYIGIVMLMVGLQSLFPFILAAALTHSALVFIWCGTFFILGKEPQEKDKGKK